MLVHNTVARSAIKVNGKPPILGTRSPKTPGLIDLKFDVRDYIRDLTQRAKNRENQFRKDPLAKGVKCHVQMFLYFCIGRPIHCNHYVGHYSGFSGISRSILNRFAPNLQA